MKVDMWDIAICFNESYKTVGMVYLEVLIFQMHILFAKGYFSEIFRVGDEMKRVHFKKKHKNCTKYI